MLLGKASSFAHLPFLSSPSLLCIGTRVFSPPDLCPLSHIHTWSMSSAGSSRRVTRSAARAAAQPSSLGTEPLVSSASKSLRKRGANGEVKTRKNAKPSNFVDSLDMTESKKKRPASKPHSAPKGKSKIPEPYMSDEIVETSCNVPWGACADELLKVATWNVNGCRSVVRSGELLAYVDREQPDLLLLQETKLTAESEAQIPAINGYEVHWNHCTAKKGYSGVATLVASARLRRKGVSVESVCAGMGEEIGDSEGRVLTTILSNGLAVVNAYVPNVGSKLVRMEYRVKTFEPRMRKYLNELREKHQRVVYAGDLNVAHAEIDIHNSKGNQKNAGHTLKERQEFTNLLADGWVDVFRQIYPKKRAYTYFSLRFGDRMQKENKGSSFRVRCVAVMCTDS